MIFKSAYKLFRDTICGYGLKPTGKNADHRDPELKFLGGNEILGSERQTDTYPVVKIDQIDHLIEVRRKRCSEKKQK